MKPGPSKMDQLRALREAKAARQFSTKVTALNAGIAGVDATKMRRYGKMIVTKTPLPKAAERARLAVTVNRGGRPKKANALTPAQKQAAYRARLKAKP